MAQIINETGDIKVMNNKGEVKWFCKRIVEDKQLMKSMKYETVDAPECYPVFDNNKLVENFVSESENNVPPIEKTETKRPYKSRK